MWLLIASLVSAVVQITMGSAVRVTGSGDGCPDWPTCFGSWIPPFEYHALMEYSHRTIGVVLGITIIAVNARIWIRYRSYTAVITSATAALVAVAIAGGVGGAVVLSELDPALRTLHLILAESVGTLLIYALVSSIYTSKPGQGDLVPSGLVVISVIAALATLAALLSGSYAVWRGAGTVCPSWPLCGGPLIPQSHLVWIHLAHRVFAILAAVIALWAGHAAMRHASHPRIATREIRMVGFVVTLLVVAQILLGAANPWTGFDQWARVSHLTLATLQWTALTLLALLTLNPIPRGILGDSNEELQDSVDAPADLIEGQQTTQSGKA